MSRTRHRRLQKTRRKYENMVRFLERWPHPLDEEAWTAIKRWGGHGGIDFPLAMEMLFSIRPETNPVFAMTKISGFTRP